MDAEDFVPDSDEEQDALEAVGDPHENEQRQEVYEESIEDAEDVQVSVQDVQEVEQSHTDVEDAEPKELQIGTLVEVASRTWPGINKPGGAGRVRKFYWAKDVDGDDQLYYDVSYVMGGFEKCIASEYVKSSKLLEKQSNREHVDREYYHDDFINKPYEEQQKRIAKKREWEATHSEHNGAVKQPRKRQKHSHRVHDEAPGAHSDEMKKLSSRTEEKPATGASRDSDASYESKPSALETSSELFSDQEIEAAPQSPPPPRIAANRRRQHIIVSSDEESSEDDTYSAASTSDADRNTVHVEEDPPAARRHGATAQQRRQHKRRKTRSSKTMRYVGGYEDDEGFIQPEGNSEELPEDVIRTMGIRLATTKHGLKKQLREVYGEMQQKMIDFHTEQAEINSKVKQLSAMDTAALNGIYEKVCEMETYITKTLVNCGEDVMNIIMKKLLKNSELPQDLQLLDQNIDKWQEKLNMCNPWARRVKQALENAFERRNELVPSVKVAQSEYSSDSEQSAYSADESYTHEIIVDAAPVEEYQFTAPTKVSRRKKPVSSTTLDDYFPRQDPKQRFNTNIRLIGRQRISTSSDPRFNWAKLARKNQPRTRQRSITPADPRFNWEQQARKNQMPKATGVVSDRRQRNITSADPRVNWEKQALKNQLPKATSVVSDHRLAKQHVSDPPAPKPLVSEAPFAFEDVLEDAEQIRVIEEASWQALPEFGWHICGPSVPQHLFSNNSFDLVDVRRFGDVVRRQFCCLRQLLNDLRLQEREFMEALARESSGAGTEEAYMSSPEWIALVSLEETYHTVIASFAAQLLEALEGIHVSALPDHLQMILEQMGALLRQLPDCESLFGDCKAYFFYFEVASRDARTTPLLTAISHTYWYSLELVGAMRSTSLRLMGTQKVVNDVFLRTLAVNRVKLAAMLFLFDLYLYLPSSHRLGEETNAIPALSLWKSLYGRSTSEVPLQESQDKEFWDLLRTVYRERYFDELARCFVRGETSGGYMRNFTPEPLSDSVLNAEVLESRLLALEMSWELVILLSSIGKRCENMEYSDAADDAKWEVVKQLLQRGKPELLLGQNTVLPKVQHHASIHAQLVLKRILKLSTSWQPSKDIVEDIVRRVWAMPLNHLDDVMELPDFVKQFAAQCQVTTSLSRLVEDSDENDEDLTSLLCKIIWVQLNKQKKRVLRGRFRRSILSAIPPPPDKPQVSSTTTVAAPRKDWVWGNNKASTSAKPAKAQPPPKVQPIEPEKGRMATSILLTFAIIGVCLECGEDEKFPSDRSVKDIKYMEREVDFYCKEILRWANAESEVLCSQALYAFGALLLQKNSTEFPVVFGGLNGRLEASLRALQANPLPKRANNTADRTRDPGKLRRRHQSAALSPLYQLRDLTRKLILVASASAESVHGAAVEKSLEYILSTGLDACLTAATHKLVAVEDLQIALEILQLVLPRAQDKPKHALATEFDSYNTMDDEMAELDLDGIVSGCTQVVTPTWSVELCRPKAIQLIIGNLRVGLQQLVLNYPGHEASAFEELYAIDLLGRLISTCQFQFFWTNLTSTSAKSRNLAPRVLSAALKYNPEKEWLGTAFLKNHRAGQELATAWLMGTLDMAALNSTAIVFKGTDNPLSVESSATPATKANCRDSSYWVMLTDELIYHLLRPQPVGFLSFDPQLLQLLRGVASTCKFRTVVQENESGLDDFEILYDVHLDVFQAFCKSAGTMWQSYLADQTAHRNEMNQLRMKTMNPQSGIFVSFLDSYKLNFRRACSKIDQFNHDWHMFAELFLNQAGADTLTGQSYHDVDDTIKSFGRRLRGVTTMFRFMYQCMDSFLFHCGEMAIGDTNLFFDAMELLFRQVGSTEYTQASERLPKQSLIQRSGVRDLNVELRKGFCSQSMTFVNSVQLFFARQKYPSLLHWFAQTSEIYQTFKGGWSLSPLRTLLVNILDPEGPLGIHNYYPDSHTSRNSKREFRVGAIRREAFYLSCGLFHCKCTKAFEHSQARHTSTSDKVDRVKSLRGFVLNDFVMESLEFAVRKDRGCFLETMVPLCQFVRAVLNHANLNANAKCRTDISVDRSEGFELRELHGCLECIVECLIKTVPAGEAVNSTISCVLVIELCGIVSEAIAFNNHRPHLEFIDLVELVVCYLRAVFVALSKTSTHPMPALFASGVCVPLSRKLGEYRFSSSNSRDVLMEQIANMRLQGDMESYDISLARTRPDVLAAIREVMERCKESYDDRLRSFTTPTS